MQEIWFFVSLLHEVVDGHFRLQQMKKKVAEKAGELAGLGNDRMDMERHLQELDDTHEYDFGDCHIFILFVFIAELYYCYQF